MVLKMRNSVSELLQEWQSLIIVLLIRVTRIRSVICDIRGMRDEIRKVRALRSFRSARFYDSFEIALVGNPISRYQYA